MSIFFYIWIIAHLKGITIKRHYDGFIQVGKSFPGYKYWHDLPRCNCQNDCGANVFQTEWKKNPHRDAESDIEEIGSSHCDCCPFIRCGILGLAPDLLKPKESFRIQLECFHEIICPIIADKREKMFIFAVNLQEI